MAGPAAGPPLGGWIVSNAHWRWVFALFALLGLTAAGVSKLLLNDIGHREKRELDVVGWLMATSVVGTPGALLASVESDQSS